MPIDDCTYDFDTVVKELLPAYMNRLAAAPLIGLNEFSKEKIGVQSLIRRYSMDGAGDFRGLYVFYEDEVPFYVGISRGVISRIRQHVKGRTHFDASLAYRMAFRSYGKQGRRRDLMDEDDFKILLKGRILYGPWVFRVVRRMFLPK